MRKLTDRRSSLRLGACAVELLLRKLGVRIREDNVAEQVGYNAQRAPGGEVGGAEDGVNTRWPRECKLKRSQRQPLIDQLDCQWVGEYLFYPPQESPLTYI